MVTSAVVTTAPAGGSVTEIVPLLPSSVLEQETTVMSRARMSAAAKDVLAPIFATRILIGTVNYICISHASTMK
jgi:hypothetical protein